VTTDTYDASGKVTRREDPSAIGREQVESALASFCGLIQQTPPMYSAVKHEGKRLYQLARAGIEVERKSRPVRIYHLELTDWQPPSVTIEVACGKGTYIRSLAHDLGQVLGCGASLKSLVRLRYGVFDIEDAVSLPHLEKAFHCGYGQRYLYPIDIVLLNWAAVIVSDDTGQKIRHGRPVILESGGKGADCLHQPSSTCPALITDRCRAYTLDGSFLAVLRFNRESEQWQPEKVFLRGLQASEALAVVPESLDSLHIIDRGDLKGGKDKCKPTVSSVEGKWR